MADWKPFPEDPRERAQFERGVQMCDGDVRRHIAHALRIWAAVHSGGSYAEQCHIMANEVMKLELPDGVPVVQAPNAPKPMQGLADWLRAVAETQAKDTEQEACMRQWAREVDAASGVDVPAPEEPACKFCGVDTKRPCVLANALECQNFGFYPNGKPALGVTVDRHQTFCTKTPTGESKP